jgi:serine/threonine protein kinase
LRLTDPERIGPYRVLRLLGIGGMGQVYLARSPGGRTVAVKVIRPDLAAERGFRERFAREVAAARGVSGIFTAAVVDADPDADLPWMATAYVDGPSLADVVGEHGPLPPDAVFALAAGLAEGLQAIHQAGLVHRDLKPSNVLLAADGPRVIDFGVSWTYQDSRLTDAGLVVGSPGFISPEQALDREVGPASDVFSLGAVLTYAACGQGPFGSGNAQAIMYRLVNEQPDLSAVPDQLRHLVGACLAKEPGLRPTTAQLLARLAESVPDVPLTTGPLAEDPGTARLTATGASRGSPGLDGRESRMYMAGLPATGDWLPAADPMANAQGVRGQTRGYPDGAAFLGDDARRPWDAESDGPAAGARASRSRVARRRAWPVVAVVGCVVAGAGVTMALTLSPSRQHPDPAGPDRSARPTEASSSHDVPGTSSPSTSSSQVPGSATRPASATPAGTGTPRATSSSAPAQASGAPKRSSASASASASAQPSSTGTTTRPPSTAPSTPSTAPSTPSSPSCVLLCIG